MIRGRSVDRRLLALVAFVGLLALSGCAQPPPPEFCEDCESYVSGTIEEGDPGVEVRYTELTLSVERDGGSEYRLRTLVNESAADRFRGNPDRLDRVAAEVREEHPGSDPSVFVDGNAVVVTREGPDLGRRGVGGVVLVTRFYDLEDDRGLRLGVDRLVIRGPEGWVVTKAPGDATAGRDRVAYTRDGAGASRYAASVSEHTLIAFAPDRSPLSRAATRATVGTAIAGDVAFQAGIAAGPAVLGLAAVVGTLLSLGVAMGDRIPLRVLGAFAVAAVLGLGGLLVGGVVLVGGLGGDLAGTVGSLVTSPWAVGAGLAMAGTLVGAVLAPFYLDRDRVAPLLVTGGRLLAGGTLALLAAFVLTGVAGPAMVPLGLAAPVVCFLPFGYAIGVESRDRWLYPAAILLAPVGAMLPLVPAEGLFPWAAGLLAMPVWAVVTGFVGIVLFFSGYGVAVDADPADLGLGGPVADPTTGSESSD